MKYKLIHIKTNFNSKIMTFPFYDIYSTNELDEVTCLSGIPQSIGDAFSYLEKSGFSLSSKEDRLSFEHNKDNIIAEADTIEELKGKVIEYLI